MIMRVVNDNDILKQNQDLAFETFLKNFLNYLILSISGLKYKYPIIRFY